MATFNKINAFVAALAHAKHNLASDQLMVAFTNTAHTAAWDELADLTEIAYTNFSSRVITTTSSSQTSGTYSLVLQDLTVTYSGGSASPTFRYVYIYNNTATGKDLIGYYDYGTGGVTLNTGETFLIDFTDAQKLFELV